MSHQPHSSWFTAHEVAEAIQMPRICFSDALLRETEPAIDRLGMPIVTSGQFAYVFKLRLPHNAGTFAVRCFRSYAPDRARRYELIDEHLRTHIIPALGGFDYDATGITIEGKRFPVLVMPWIEGHTLDVYLSEVFRRGNNDRHHKDDGGNNNSSSSSSGSSRETVRRLADEWLRVIASLRDAEVAHGDLQHGNIIVEAGRLRLVDLDGMFVPAMRGKMQAAEIGHQHFQHPRRTPDLFDETLDRFSALVIYLSLIALAEKPALWHEYHDENLLFTKKDFLAPDDSKLFAEVEGLSDECRKFAALLKTAARSDNAREVPDLLRYVNASDKPKLPGWMSATSVEAATIRPRTREATRIDLPAQVLVREQNLTRPVAVSSLSANQKMPVTPQSATVQSLFSGSSPRTMHGTSANVLVAAHDPFAAPLDPAKFWQASVHYGKQTFLQGAGFSILFGFQAIWRLLGKLIGLPFPLAMLCSLMVFVGIFLFIGMARAYKHLAPDNRNLTALNLPPITLPRAAPKLKSPDSLRSSKNFQPLQPYASLGVASVAPLVNAATLNGAKDFVGSRTQGIYHLASCEWASRIAERNRIPFPSSQAAQDAGFRQCKVCNP